MGKNIKSIKTFLFVVILSVANSVLAQEYDDMYFTKADRKQTDFDLIANRQDAERVMSAFDDDELEEVYLDKNINPEYIAKYQVQSDKKSSRRNQEVDYYPEATSSNISSTSGYFNNYGRQATIYTPASFNINFVSSYGFSRFNNRFMYGYDPYGNVWMSDFYNPYANNPYGYNSYDPFGYGFSRPFYSSGFNGSYNYPNVRAFNNYYCPPAYSYNTGYNSVVLAEGYQEVRRAKVIGPRGSGGSKTVVRGGMNESRSTDLNRRLSSTNVRSTSSVRDFGNQKSQNEYIDRSISKERTNQSFARSNAVETQSRSNAARYATSSNRSNTTVNKERSTVIENNRGVATQMNSSRRYNTTSMSAEMTLTCLPAVRREIVIKRQIHSTHQALPLQDLKRIQQTVLRHLGLMRLRTTVHRVLPGVTAHLVLRGVVPLEILQGAVLQVPVLQDRIKIKF